MGHINDVIEEQYQSFNLQYVSVNSINCTVNLWKDDHKFIKCQKLKGPESLSQNVPTSLHTGCIYQALELKGDKAGL